MGTRASGRSPRDRKQEVGAGNEDRQSTSFKIRPGRPPYRRRYDQSIYPSLAYEDAHATIGWLQKAFGFEAHLVVAGPDGAVPHAELRTPSGALVMLLSTAMSTRRNRSPRSLGGTAQSVYVAVDDADHLDELYARAEAEGADVFNPLSETDHGRELCCLDPEGHIWTFGTYRPQA